MSQTNLLKTPTLTPAQQAYMKMDPGPMRHWETLSTALDLIYDGKQSSCSFQVLHQASYQLERNSHAAFLYESLEDKIAKRVVHQRDVIRQAAGSTILLSALVSQWDIHEVMMRRTSDIAMNLTKYCLEKKIPLIGARGKAIFGEIVLGRRDITEAIMTAFMELIDRDREGQEAPPVMLLRSTAKVFIAIDRALWFEAKLEARYLERVELYYTNEANRLASTASVPEYIQHFWVRLREEAYRAASCLDEQSVSKVESILVRVFITEHSADIIGNEASGVNVILKSWRLPELHSIYRAFARAHDVGSIVYAAAQFFEAEGHSINANPEPSSSRSPVLYIERLIELRQKIRVLLREVFSREDKPGVDRLAEVELIRVFDAIVNSNPSTTPEHLSRFIDTLIVRGELDDAAFESICGDALLIYRSLRDKDVFENAYRSHLARRLLLGRVATEDREKWLVQKLREESGAAVSLEGMLADRATSEELMGCFRSSLEPSPPQQRDEVPIGFSVFVLTSGFWPPCSEMRMTLPPDMGAAAAAFAAYYKRQFRNRRFDFALSLGTVDIRLNWCGKVYDINVPTMCSAPLLLFHGDEPLRVDEVARRTGMSEADALKAVVSLAHSTAMSSGILEIEGVITASSLVRFNRAFRSRTLKMRVVIAQSKDKPTPAAATPAREHLEEDRKYKLDAAIVRVMKSRRMFAHNALVAEVIAVTKSFTPSTELIKRRIEHLIEREFLERSKENRSVYKYVA